MRMAQAAALFLATVSLASGAGDAARTVTAEAAGVRATLSADPGAPAVGEAVTVTLSVGGPEGTRAVTVPEIAKVLQDALGEDVVEVRDVRRDDDGMRFTVYVYDAGPIAFPGFDVSVAEPSHDAQVLHLEGLTLDVGEVVPEDAEPLPERDAIAPAEERSYGVWIAALAALAALSAALLFLRRRARPRELLAVPPPPPHVHALGALEGLLAERLPQSGRVEPYFVRLSEIARTYLEERFGLRAPEQTTEEFLCTLGATPAGALAPHRELLRNFLSRADLVKFARDLPDIATCDAAAADVRSLVVATAPPPGPAPESAP